MKWFPFKRMCWLFSEFAIPAAQEVLKNNLILAHTSFSDGPEIDDHIIHSKANSVEKKYPHTSPAAPIIPYSTLTSTFIACAQTVLSLFKLSPAIGKTLIIVLFTKQAA